MSKSITIDGRKIGRGFPPYIVAEMSANHNGSIEAAYKIIEAAKKAGADAVKIQTYRPETITLDCDKADFQIDDGPWSGRTLYELYEWAHTPWQWHALLFEYAHKLGITLFSSPFDNTAVDLLENLNAPAYKISSFELTDLPLIKYVANTGKPMIISTGMADVDEIGEAIEAARLGGAKELALLRCVSGYPAPAKDYNLKTLPDMQQRFGLVTGLSDHTLGITTAIAGVALGASIIEKHFTLERNRGGPDDSFSLEAGQLAALCRRTNIAWEALGSVNYDPKSSEIGNVKFRRSLYAVEHIHKGQVITNQNVRSIRPGFGLPPKYLDTILGRKALVDIEAGVPITRDMIE
jgi:N-acetylneuraminate synthase